MYKHCFKHRSFTTTLRRALFPLHKWAGWQDVHCIYFLKKSE